METVYVSLNNGRYCKRGFLHLPFCTIYGFTILAIYYFIGTPKEGGLFLRKLEGKKRILPYILLAMLIPSIAFAFIYYMNHSFKSILFLKNY